MSRRPAIGLILVLAMTLESSAAEVEPLAPMADLDWISDDPLFGGISAIEVSDDGLGFVVLSDRGAFARGQLLRDAAGVLTGLQADGPMGLLHDAKGAVLTGFRTDSEGLAIDAAGNAYVAFETATRVFLYPQLEGRAKPLPRHRDFKKLAGNNSLEALAVAADGTLYALPEAEGPATQGFPVYRYRDGEWTIAGSVPRHQTFLPTAADIGPDGRLYLLERAFHGVFGFASRIRRFDIGAEGLSGEVVLLTTPLARHGNLEGLAVWRNAQGGLMATMVADNNKLEFLQTEVVEYLLPAD